MIEQELDDYGCWYAYCGWGHKETISEFWWQRGPLLVAEIRRLRSALQEIRGKYGQVCPEFETCNHPWCRSSCAAWQIADEALRGGDQ